jgi:hypothetical protein
MIKILHIITDLGVGGAERMLLKLLTKTDRNRFDPTVVSLTSEGPLAPEIGKLGITVLSIGMKRGIPGFSDFEKLKSAIKEIRPDLVQTWMYHADLLGGTATKLTIKAHVLWGVRHSVLTKKSNKGSTILTAKICAFLSRKILLKLFAAPSLPKLLIHKFDMMLPK